MERGLSKSVDNLASILQEKSLVTLNVDGKDTVSLKLERIPQRNVDNSGTRVIFTQVPDFICSDPSEENLSKWASEVISTEKNNRVIHASLRKPPNHSHVLTDKVQVEFVRPPRALVLHEALAIATKVPFTRNITLDKNFDAPRYSWASPKRCSHCSVTGHMINDCPVRDVDWKQSTKPKPPTITSKPPGFSFSSNSAKAKPSPPNKHRSLILTTR